VTAALRAVDPSANQRALRRGALQLLASQGSSLGHKKEDTLMRYVDFGREDAAGAHDSVEAARLLSGTH